MERAAIISLVSAFMDEITPEQDSVNIVSVIAPLIGEHLDYAALRLLELLPVSQQKVFTPIATLRTQLTPSFLRVFCPGDFIKLGSVRISGWERSATNVLMDGSLPAQTQVLRFMAGTRLRPTVVLEQVPVGFALELRPPASDNITAFYYVKKRKAHELEDELIDPLVYLTAARVYESVREIDSAKVCYEQLNRYIQSNALKATNP